MADENLTSEDTPLVDQTPSLGAVMDYTSGVNPDSHAKDLKLSRATGAPLDIVKFDPAAIEREVLLHSIDKYKQRDYPQLHAFMRDVNLSPVVRDDHENLAGIESTLSGGSFIQPVETALASAAQATYGAIEGSLRLPQFIKDSLELASRPFEKMTGVKPFDVLEDKFTTFKRIKTLANLNANMLAGVQEGLPMPGGIGSESFKRANMMGQNAEVAFDKAMKDGEFKPIFDIIKDPEADLTFIAQAVPSMLLGMASKGSLPIIMAMEGGSELVSQAQTEREKGITLPLEQKVQATAQTALINGMLEKVGFDYLRRFKVFQKFFGEADKAGVNIADIFKTIGVESGTEAMQQLNQNLAQILTYNPEQSITSGVLQSAIGGAGGGAVFGTAGYAAERGYRKAEKAAFDVSAKVNETDQQKIDKLAFYAQNSKTRGRDTDTLRQFANSIDDTSNVYIDGTAAREYLQGKSAEEIKADPALGALQQAVQASEPGTDVSIKVADFAADIVGSKHYEALRPNMKLDPNTPSPAMAQAAKTEADNYANRLIEEAKQSGTEYAESQDIFAKVRDQIIDTGRMSPQDAGKVADVVSAYFTVHAKDRGIPIAQAYQEAGLSIEGPMTGRPVSPAAMEQVTAEEIDAIKDMPTVEVMQKAMDIVGEDKFKELATAKLDKLTAGGKFKASESMATEATAREIVALNNRESQQKLMQPVGVSPDLLIQHNLSEENLLHAMKMGGIAVPSLAVTKKESPMTNFGEITLLGSPELADPRGYAKTKVYGADIYSPRYPTISYTLSKESLTKLNEMLKPYRAEGEREIYSSEINRIDDLTQVDAFKKYADEKIGGTAKWSQMKSLAQNMLTEAGADERIFMGFTNMGNRKYIPHTLENVVKILKKELRGGEGTNYGVSSVRAHFTPQFKSLAQIKKEKGRLVTETEFNKVKEEVDKEFTDIWSELEPFHPASNSFGFGDTVSYVIQDAAKMGIPRALKENGFDSDVPVEVQEHLRDYMNKLRNLPTEYFEAKILRDVDLSEFSGAVVPDNAKQETIDALKSRGVTDIRTYKAGDNADRAAKIGEFEHLLFQKQGEQARGYYDPSQTLIRLTEASNLSTFIHEFGHFMLDMERRNPNSRHIEKIHQWIKRNAADVAMEANGYLGKFGAMEQPFEGSEVAKTPWPADQTTIEVDGKQRPALNSNGKPIHWSEEGIRNFWRWFGDSKVVDTEGRPLVVYHSTSAEDDFTKFRRRTGDIGMHFGTIGQAEDRWQYTNQIGGDYKNPRIMSVYLAIKNPLRLTDAGIWNADNLDYQLLDLFPNDASRIAKLKSTKDIREFIQSKGYDGVVYKNTGETAGADEYRRAVQIAKAGLPSEWRGKNSFSVEDMKNPAYVKWSEAQAAYDRFREEAAEDSYIAFEPTQIKSAIGNIGAFDPNNPNILQQPADVFPNTTRGAMLRTLWNIGSSEELFRLPTSTKMDMAGVANDMAPGKFSVRELENPPEDAARKWKVEFTVDGSPRSVSITEDHNKGIFIDVSSLKQGELGSAIYQIAASYAHNTGREFIPDPNGVSDVAVPRRIENLLSSALRYGTTKHIVPGEVTGVNWINGNDDHNILELIKASIKAVSNNVAQVNDLEYDFSKGEFIVKGEPNVTVDDKTFGRLAKRSFARPDAGGLGPLGTGSTTLQRAVLARSILRQASSSEGRRILETFERDLQKPPVALKGLFYQAAYHGSPYKFDKFSLEHMGKGEGAQAYGWGLYFAGNREVAEWYRKNLSQGEVYISGKKFEPKNYDITGLVGLHDGTDAELEKKLRDYAARNEGNEYAHGEDAIKIANAIKKGVFSRGEKGQLYRVEIPEDDTMLHWDKPLSEQSEKVREALIRAYINQKNQNETKMRTWINSEKGFSGSDVYHEFQNMFAEDGLQGDEAASKYLHSLGINGIKYLDGTSRSKGEGNYNYVVFDDTTINILDTYYQNGPVQKTEGAITAADVVAHLEQGTSGDKAKDAAIDRAIHEQFARGFETYLMEGKAPSIELRNVFRTFARWLVQVYKSIRGDLQVNLDEDMRQVFARMLATDEQIAAAEARVRFEPMFNDAAMAGMSEEEFQKYNQRTEKVRDKAHETLRDKLIEQLTRQTKAWWNEEKADLAAQEEDRLKQERVYRAIDQLRNGDIKLDTAAVKEGYSEQRTDKLGRTMTHVNSKLSGMTASGGNGVHPDIAAGMLGYGSGDEMIQDIIAARPIKEVAKENAQQQMLDKHGDILTDGTIEKEADEALQNEERGKMILDELKALTKGTGRAAIEREALRSLATDAIGKLSFRQINPAKYRAAEIKAAQEATSMLAKGNKEGAAAAKMRQALNFYLGKAATEAKNDTVKIVDRMARYRKKDVQQAIQKAGNGYWEQLVKLLERFEFRKSATMRQVDKTNENINVWMKARIEEDGDALVLSAAALDEGYLMHWKNVPYSDLVGISDSVKNIEHVARYGNKIIGMEQEMEFQQLVQKWTGSMNEKVATRFPAVASAADKAGGVEKWGRWAMAQMTKIPYMASWLDGGERAGLSHDILVQPFTNAYNEELKLWREIGTPIIELIGNRSKEDLKRHNTKVFIPEIRGTAGHTGNLMGHEVLAVALNTGNKSNLKKMLLGEGWAHPENEAEITFENPKLQAVLRHMTKSDWELVQAIWDQMELLYPMLAETHRRTTGLTPPKIEPTAITINGVTYRGGYYPVKYDPARSHRAQMSEDKLNAETESMFGNAGIQASVNASATNERTGYYAPIRLSLDVVPNHFQETIHFITHHDAVRQVNKLLRNESVAITIREKLGNDEFAQLKPWLNDIAKDGREAPTKTFWGTILQRLRFGTTLGVMGFKASTGILQTLGLSNTVGEVGLASTLQAARSILGSPSTMQGAWDFAAANSKVMNHRMETMDREIKNAMRRLEGKHGFMAAVQETSMKHIALIQTYMVDLPTWHAAYIKGMKQWGDQERAFKYADWAVENIQGSGVTKDMAQIMRNQSEEARMFTMFMTFFSSLWNMERDIVKGARSGYYSKTTIAAKLMFYFTIPVFLEMILRGDFGGDDKDPEELLQKYLTNLALYPVQSIPFVRDIANATLGDYGYNVSPIAQLIEQGVQHVPALVKAPFTDDEIKKSDVKGSVKFVGAIAGVPGTGQAWATGEHLYNVMENGEDLTLKELLYGPERKAK